MTERDHELQAAVIEADEIDRLRVVNAELLAALWEMLREYEPASSSEYPDAVILAHAVIAKAEGRS